MSELNDNASANPVETQGAVAPEQTVTDLDGLSQFKFQGETYTPDRLTEVFQGYQKYGETSKYVEQDSNYWENVFHDIDKVVQNPARAAEFKQLYPERFHALLDRHLSSKSTVTPDSAQTNQTQSQLPKEIQDKLDRLERGYQTLEQREHQAKVEASLAKIDAVLPPLLEKYQLADEDKVLFEAEKLLSKGYKMTDSAWERLAKEDHERTMKRADKVYEAKLNQQISKGKQAADIGSGGATPGQAPVKPRTFKEAEDAMIAHVRSQRG